MVRYVCTVKWVSKEGVTELREGGKFQGIWNVISFFLNIKEPLFVTIQYIPKIEFDPIDVFPPFLGLRWGILMRFPCYVWWDYIYFCACL